MDLADVVSAVFVHQGFQIMSVHRGETQGKAGIVVRRGPLEIAIAAVPGSSALDGAQLREILVALSAQRGARQLIAYAGHPSAAARSAAAEEGAVLWDRERLMAEAGAALVGTADPDPSPGVAGGQPSADSLLESGESRALPRQAGRGWADAAPSRKRTLAPVRAADIDALQGAPPLLLEERDARAIAESLLKSKSIRAALEWVSFFFMDFHLDVEVRTPRGEEALLHSGSLLVSASGGEVEDLDRPVEVVLAQAAVEAGDLERAMARRRVTLSEARDRARTHALAGAVRTVERVNERASVVVTERHAWRPKGSHVDLVARGLLVVPLWLVEAEHGLASISGASGRALRVAPFAGERAPQGA